MSCVSAGFVGNIKHFEWRVLIKKGSFISALELDAKNPYINSNLAQAYLEERDFGRAEYHAMKAISANRDSPKVR